MKKRALSLLAACILSVGAFSVAAGAEESVTVTEMGEYSADDPYHCVFAYFELTPQDAATRQAVEDALNEHLVPNYHLEVELFPMAYSEYQTTIQNMITGGDELDVIPIYYTYASSWAAMDGIVDLSAYMDSEEGQKILEALGETYAKASYLGDMLFGFPANKESVELGGLVLRSDICDELGFTEKYGLEKNADEYTGKVFDWSVAEEMFEAVKENYPEIIPLYLQGTGEITMRRLGFWDELGDILGVLDLEADPNSTTVVNKFETEHYVEAVKMLARWYDAGYIYKDAATDSQGGQTMMKAGNTFSYMSAIKPGYLVEKQAAHGRDCYVMYFGNKVAGGIATTNVAYFNTGIATNSEDPEMAFKFISALYSDPLVMNLWQNGIEDVNYQVLDDGTAYFVDGEDASNYKYHMGTSWCQGNQFISYVWNDGSKDAGYWDKLKAHNEWALYSPAFGFLWDASDYSTEITALKNALATYIPALETGSVGGADKVDEILQKLNNALYAAGLQDVMDAKQEQLDAWLSENGATQTPAENLEKIAGVETGVIMPE